MEKNRIFVFFGVLVAVALVSNAILKGSITGALMPLVAIGVMFSASLFYDWAFHFIAGYSTVLTLDSLYRIPLTWGPEILARCPEWQFWLSLNRWAMPAIYFVFLSLLALWALKDYKK